MPIESGQLIPDGGRYTETLYAWHDPDTDTLLYHTEVNDEYADPFFDTEDEAYDFLEKHAENGAKEEYDNLSLKKLRGKKVGDAVDVLTDQAGIQDFAPDGGTTEEVYLWYDPGLNAVIQDEITPGLYAGIFDQEEEAIHFMKQHQDREEIDPGRLELYRADWEKIGSGDSVIGNG